MPASPGSVPVAEGGRAAANQRPSGDHDSAERTGKSLSFRSDPPTGETRWIVPWPFWNHGKYPAGERTNAICRPSGDQLGSKSVAGSVVKRWISEDPVILR